MDNKIQMFIHCRKCLEQLPRGMSPRDYASLEIGWTDDGLQVWCKRHEIEVIHIEATTRNEDA